MKALRNFKYHQSNRAFPDELPPTSHSLRAHIMRAFYITNRMNSLLLTNWTLLDPVHYGYEEIDEMVLHDTGENPIPEEFAVVCNCIKCSSKKC